MEKLPLKVRETMRAAMMIGKAGDCQQIFSLHYSDIKISLFIFIGVTKMEI
tara:strand:+ start:442 stop:594 length:153 start_codon:yes stop_codon:yes gene_type:complete